MCCCCKASNAGGVTGTIVLVAVLLTHIALPIVASVEPHCNQHPSNIALAAIPLITLSLTIIFLRVAQKTDGVQSAASLKKRCIHDISYALYFLFAFGWVASVIATPLGFGNLWTQKCGAVWIIALSTLGVLFIGFVLTLCVTKCLKPRYPECFAAQNSKCVGLLMAAFSCECCECCQIDDDEHRPSLEGKEEEGDDNDDDESNHKTNSAVTPVVATVVNAAEEDRENNNEFGYRH